jgi:hypothetical protein
MDLVAQENSMTYNEFMPWQVWINLPENKNLTHDDALRKFNVERDAHLKKLIWYENQARINQNNK